MTTEAPDSYLRESDAFSWYMERDPALRSTIVAVAWLDQSPRWEVLVDRLDRASRAVPVFRMRLVEPPARLSTPRWVLDSDFDLAWHVRHIDAPPPYTPAAVLEVARNAAMTAFDPAHPLWEFTLVEGMSGGEAALLMKLHHSLTDGIGGMDLALRLFDAESARSARLDTEPMPPAPEGSAVGAIDIVRDSVKHQVGRVLHVVGHDLAAAGPAVARASRHPYRSAADVVETARSIGRTVAPVAETLSPVMTGRSLRRHLDVLTVDLAALKGAARRAGGTLNDGFLAAVTGALRRYHTRHGAAVEQLRVTMPISIRKATDPAAGNRITLQRFTLPLGPEDPGERIPLIGERCRAARAERSLPHTNAIAGTLNLLPPAVIGGMLKHVDFLASNVPGFPFPVYLAGARVTGYVAFGPTIGAALNLTLMSYDGTCYLGVNMDEAAVPDPGVMLECLRQGFAEVLALAVDAPVAEDVPGADRPAPASGEQTPVRRRRRASTARAVPA